MMLRTRSCRSAIILSVIICERTRSPFEGLASVMGLSNNPSWTSEESGQTNTVDKSLVNLSACTTTPAVAVPVRSERPPARLPRFTSSRSSRMRRHFRNRWRHFPDVAPSVLPAGANRPVPWDPANPEPNAALDASLVRATARGARPCAAAGCVALPSSGWPYLMRKMLRIKIQRFGLWTCSTTTCGHTTARRERRRAGAHSTLHGVVFAIFVSRPHGEARRARHTRSLVLRGRLFSYPPSARQ